MVVWHDEITQKRKSKKIEPGGGVNTARGRKEMPIAEHVHFIHPTAQPLLRTWGRPEIWSILQALAVNILCEGESPWS